MDKAVEGPDRGWSWVIAVVAFMNYFIVSGIFRSFGVIFVAFIREYGISREEASWPAMLSVSFLGFSGAVAGPLAQRFGVRPVVFSGSIIGAVGFSACSLTTSFTAVTLLIGVAFGFFRDNMGSYSNIFYLLGLLSIATSLLWLLEKCLAKKPTSAVNND